ncbi:MAG TPA: DcaP family trimeric outer membrane transporter [Gemmatimonadaceae bacterium]|jgi:hypothetical protein
MKRALSIASLLLALALRISSGQTVKTQSSKPESSKVQADTGTRIEVYGFAMADAIGDFRTNDPNWFDTNRPSKLPAFQDQFGHNGHTWLSARQSTFGAKATIPTGTKDIKVVFDWDLFGVGVDAGQTTIRPRHMYGQWGAFGGGQLESPFMDLNVFPNILEYWGPNGMLFYRNVQVFWEPIHKENGTQALIALERPGASGDAGLVADRIELQNIAPRFPAPDISAAYRLGTKWGYARLSAIVRWIRWDDLLPNDAFDLNGGVTGWGVSLSGAVNAGAHDVLHLQIVEGAGVENYFNDAPVDVGVKRNVGNTVTPVTGQALNDLGFTGYLDHKWTKQLSSAIGYSRVNIDNSDLQTTQAFRTGQYASVNLLWSPIPSFLTGGEFQWAHRTNNGNGFAPNDYRLQFSVKYSYSQKFGGGVGHEPTRAQD